MAYKLASPNNNKKETITDKNNNGLYYSHCLAIGWGKYVPYTIRANQWRVIPNM